MAPRHSVAFEQTDKKPPHALLQTCGVVALLRGQLGPGEPVLILAEAYCTASGASIYKSDAAEKQACRVKRRTPRY